MAAAELAQIEARIAVQRGEPILRMRRADVEFLVDHARRQVTKDYFAQVAALDVASEQLISVVRAATALEECPQCGIKALNCGHAEALHDALAALGGEDG